jgi:AraC-like DNA-binding protein
MQNEVCNYIPDKNDPWTYTWINLKGEGADQLIKSLELKENIFLWNTVKSKRSFEKIWQYKGNMELEELAALSAVFNVFAEQSVQKVMPKREYVTEAKTFFEVRFAEGVTVEDAARNLNISRPYLRNIFHKSEGVSPQGYLMKLRMNRAVELLGGDYTITEIAAAVGYDDVLQFSKIFSKYFGLSPTAFRKQNR